MVNSVVQNILPPLHELGKCIFELRFVSQYFHWVAEGVSSYQDHQLLDIIYQESNHEFDAIYEYIIAIGGKLPPPTEFFDSFSIEIDSWGFEAVNKSILRCKSQLAVVNEVISDKPEFIGLQNQISGFASRLDKFVYFVKPKLDFKKSGFDVSDHFSHPNFHRIQNLLSGIQDESHLQELFLNKNKYWWDPISTKLHTVAIQLAKEAMICQP